MILAAFLFDMIALPVKKIIKRKTQKPSLNNKFFYGMLVSLSFLIIPGRAIPLNTHPVPP